VASVSFTDTTGAATLTNIYEGTPGTRLANWRTLSPLNGEAANEMESWALHTFQYGAVYGAEFTFPDIPNSQMETVDRLIRHLYLDGGTATLNTTDAASRSYTIGPWRGAEVPEPELTDDVQLLYALTLRVVNAAASPARMLCIY
jgi:hypothetical protein